MKRYLLFLSAFPLLFPGKAVAQEISEAETLPVYPYFIPTSYTQGGKTIFYTDEMLYNSSSITTNGDFTIYDGDFNVIKEFTVPQEITETYTLVRRRAAVTDPSSGKVTYTGDWVTTRESEYEDDGVENLKFLKVCADVGQGIAEVTGDEQRLYLTQTLFNDDDKFEYLYETQKTDETSRTESDRDGDGMIDEVRIWYGMVPSALELRQDDGTVLFRHEGGGILRFIV